MPSYISSIGTALPRFCTKQPDIAEFMVEKLDLGEEEATQLRVLYRASGIRQRYSVLPDFKINLNGQGFFSEKRDFPSLKPRMVIYQKEAIKLSLDAIRNTMKNTAVTLDSLTHLITVSCTGMYAPGLDIEIVESLKLNSTIQRTAINFMGCYAAFNGLKLADQIVKAKPEARVLLVCVELCSIHLQQAKDDQNLLANSLFGDGAAAVVVTSGHQAKLELELEQFHNDLATEGKQEMGWFLGDFGFEMKLTQHVPEVIREGIRSLTTRLLEKLNLNIPDIPYYAMHPGGRKILQVIEEALGVTRSMNMDAHEILKNRGNMSSPTVLFVIQHLLSRLDHSSVNNDRILSFAFGPGLTMESMLLKIRT